MSVARTIAKNTAYNFVITASETIFNLFIGILLARFLGPADYGLYSFLIWFLYFVFLFANLGLGHMVIRFIAEAIGQQNQAEVKSLINLAFWFRFIAAAVCVIIIIAFSGYWSDLFGYPENRGLFILVALCIIPQVFNFLLVSIFSGFQKYEYGAYVVLGTSPLRALGIVIVVILGMGIEEVLYVSIGSWILGIFIGLFLLRRLVPLDAILARPSLTPSMRRAFKYSLIMMGVWGIQYFMRQRAEILFLGIFNPGEDVGFYTIAFLVSSATIGTVLQVFSTVLIPAVSEQVGRGDMARVRSIYLTSARYLMILGIPMAIGGIILAGPIIRLVYGIEYEPAIILLQILFIPFTLLAIANSATSVILGVNQPSFVLKTGIWLVILSLGLEIWLISSHGAIGAAIGSSVARVIAPILYIRYASRECRTSWPMMDTIKITLAALIMGGVIFAVGTQITRSSISIVVLVPLGTLIHFALIILFRVVQKEDIDILRKIQVGLPGLPRRIYTRLLDIVEMMVKKTYKKDIND
ncbi:MAG TPA: flippase [Dehalococcoidia bacterium]|nr:flippase [Dehalococcoidia bacterium]